MRSELVILAAGAYAVVLAAILLAQPASQPASELPKAQAQRQAAELEAQPLGPPPRGKSKGLLSKLVKQLKAREDKLSEKYAKLTANQQPSSSNSFLAAASSVSRASLAKLHVVVESRQTHDGSMLEVSDVEILMQGLKWAEGPALVPAGVRLGEERLREESIVFSEVMRDVINIYGLKSKQSDVLKKDVGCTPAADRDCSKVTLSLWRRCVARMLSLCLSPSFCLSFSFSVLLFFWIPLYVHLYRPSRFLTYVCSSRSVAATALRTLQSSVDSLCVSMETAASRCSQRISYMCSPRARRLIASTAQTTCASMATASSSQTRPTVQMHACMHARVVMSLSAFVCVPAGLDALEDDPLWSGHNSIYALSFADAKVGHNETMTS